MGDARAVLDAVGLESACLLGNAEGGFLVTLLAATHPDRVIRLVLINAMAGIFAPPFNKWGSIGVALAALEASLDQRGGPDLSGVPMFAPSRANDQAFRDWLGRSYRRAASPATLRAIFEVAYRSDISSILATVTVPTLVIHRAENRYATSDHGRYLAEHIPGAKYVEVGGEDHVPYIGDADAILDEVEEFLTGARHGAHAERVLATVLFTDIVASTKRVAELGDRRWRSLLDAHDAMISRQLERFRGREIKTVGDGVIATFDGPARAISCACAIRDEVRQLGLEIRAGVHTGEIELRGADVGGIAVHIGARVGRLAGPGEVLVSRTVTDLVAGSGIAFADRGEHELKGVPGRWQLFAVTG
jgi:class 3 adenylate cyclase